jgi:Uma2 family endonuclease
MAAVEQTAIVLLALKDGAGSILELAEDGNAEELLRQACEMVPEGYRIEQDAHGDIHILPPVGLGSSERNAEIVAQLRTWARTNRRGRVFGPDVLFRFPDGSKMSADACWISNEKVRVIPKSRRNDVVEILPDFVIELKSRTDSFSKLQVKMRDYQRNGVELGWLIHPEKRKILFYDHPEDEVLVLNDPDTAVGKGPVEGFVLDLKPVWEGLNEAVV